MSDSKRFAHEKAQCSVTGFVTRSPPFSWHVINIVQPHPANLRGRAHPFRSDDGKDLTSLRMPTCCDEICFNDLVLLRRINGYLGHFIDFWAFWLSQNLFPRAITWRWVTWLWVKRKNQVNQVNPNLPPFLFLWSSFSWMESSGSRPGFDNSPGLRSYEFDLIAAKHPNPGNARSKAAIRISHRNSTLVFWALIS